MRATKNIICYNIHNVGICAYNGFQSHYLNALFEMRKKIIVEKYEKAQM